MRGQIFQADVLPRTLWPIAALLLVAYVAGAFVPLMNNDSAHHATIALYMLESGDWRSLVTHGEAYLDKPHLLFWLAALSFQLFGVHTAAYKLPSLLFSLLAVYSTWRLGTLRYSNAVGQLAALILASALAFVLANNDVRMDALLTGTIIFSIWQLVDFVDTRRWRSLVLGGLGLALGLSTKGMIGVAMPLIAVFFDLLHRRDWARLFDPRWLLLPGLVLGFAAPMLFAYHHQFGIEGIRFILWSQNFERLAGERFGNAGANDPGFFLHTFLWAFLPWSFLAIGALGATALTLVRHRLRAHGGSEGLLLGTLALLFLIISLSRFKLPHYLNILLPLFALILAAWLAPRLNERPSLALRLALGLAGLVLVGLGGILHGWIFPMTSVLPWVIGTTVLVVGLWLMRPVPRGTARWVGGSLLIAVLFNTLLNLNAYPQLLGYQAGTQLGQIVRAQNIPLSQVFTLENLGRAGSFEVTTGRLTPELSLAALRQRTEPSVIFTSAKGLEALTTQGIPFTTLAERPNYRITQLSARFLNPATRAETLTPWYLVRVTP